MLQPRPILARLCLISMMAAGGNPVAQAVEEGVCPERPPRLSARVKPRPPVDLPTEIRARELRSTLGDVGEFTGDVELRRGLQSLSSDYLRYEKSTGQVDASGDVTLLDHAGSRFETPETHFNLDTHTGYTGPSRFYLEDAQARGDAERVDFEGPDHTRLTRVRYTTCAPGQDDWFLKIRELKLDTEEDIGTAYHATVNFLGVPVFYLPYLSFPISDQRKSGFLIPQLGYSTKRGAEVAAPYYLNLAPDYDATVTPRYMSKHGLQLQNEFRYLTRNSQGRLELEVLPSDRQQNGDQRASGIYQHSQTFNPLWSGNIDVRGISDKNYLEDFSDHLGVTSQTHLPQNAELNYRGPLWTFGARAADYQTIDRTIPPAARPYARLPQLNLLLNRPVMPNRVNYYFESEASYFERDASVSGRRVGLSPAVGFPLANSYGYLTPKIGVRSLAYHLKDASVDESPSLSRGVFSLDGGLFFERDSRWGERRYTQTLEPRLFYLYIPGKNQDNLPNFDTGLPELTFANLFRENRFAGGDRIGDSNQITAAVTTRFIDEEDGSERARASIGRIYYFSDREVNLPAGTTSAAASDIAGETSATLVGNWHARANVQWNRQESHAQRYNYYLQYNPAKDRIVNAGKRFSRGELEQTDISAEWPIAGRWTFRGRSLYSRRDRHNVESYVGAEYNACCWALRLLAGRRLSFDANSAPIQATHIMFELQLTGFSKLGRVPDSPLRESVFSFPSRYAAPGYSVP